MFTQVKGAFMCTTPFLGVISGKTTTFIWFGTAPIAMTSPHFAESCASAER